MSHPEDQNPAEPAGPVSWRRRGRAETRPVFDLAAWRFLSKQRSPYLQKSVCLAAVPPIGPPPQRRAAVQQHHVCQETQKQAAHYQHRSHGNGPSPVRTCGVEVNRWGGGVLTDTSITPPPHGAAAQNQPDSLMTRTRRRPPSLFCHPFYTCPPPTRCLQHQRLG